MSYEKFLHELLYEYLVKLTLHLKLSDNLDIIHQNVKKYTHFSDTTNEVETTIELNIKNTLEGNILIDSEMNVYQYFLDSNCNPDTEIVGKFDPQKNIVMYKNGNLYKPIPQEALDNAIQ